MKTARNITIDLDIWHQVRAEARLRRVSASWLTEELLRAFLARSRRNAARARRREAAAEFEGSPDHARGD